MYKLKKTRVKAAVADFSFLKDWIPSRNILSSTFVMASVLSVVHSDAHAVTSFERLSALLAATPEGGWVKASTNLYSDAWPAGADAVQLPSYNSPAAIVNAWSSFAWDSASGKMMLFGGGHANYVGNEMYLWDGATGNWSRGSLPSKTDSEGLVVGGTAPQSAHTYDNNVFLPVNNMFLTFGGAAAGSGSNFKTTDGTTLRRGGPYLWDPAKADPTKVGGTSDIGWNSNNPPENGNMWIDRHGQWTGMEAPGYVHGTTAYRTENGRDVVYLTSDQNASGWPSLYRYTLGDVRNGESDTWERIGVMSRTVAYQGTGTLDPVHNLYIRTATASGRYDFDLAIWDLDKADAINPSSNAAMGVKLVEADGTPFNMTGAYGMDYDKANNAIVLWNGEGDGGTVWSAAVVTDEDGNIAHNTTWTVHEISSSTVEHPHGDFNTGVLGKWHYDERLGAYIALDQTSRAEGGGWDAGVWLYKPVIATIPEPETYALLLAGLGLIGWVVRRRVS